MRGRLRSHPFQTLIGGALALILIAWSGVVAAAKYADAKQAAMRSALYRELAPVSLSNCRLERFGEPHDGGYLMCGNLLERSRAVYSYGISGYDGWGCDVSRRVDSPVQEYDCFDARRPACEGGKAVFHDECVAGAPDTRDGRAFDTVANQVARNADAARRLIVKMDVEGAEWEALDRVPDETLRRIDQLVVEFHFVQHKEAPSTLRRLFLGSRRPEPSRAVDPRAVPLIERLKTFFYVVHVHVNNNGCEAGNEPFPSWAFEVLFVNRSLGVPAAGEPARTVPADAPNNPKLPDCQAAFE